MSNNGKFQNQFVQIFSYWVSDRNTKVQVWAALSNQKANGKPDRFILLTASPLDSLNKADCIVFRLDALQAFFVSHALKLAAADSETIKNGYKVEKYSDDTKCLTLGCGRPQEDADLLVGLKFEDGGRQLVLTMKPIDALGLASFLATASTAIVYEEVSAPVPDDYSPEYMQRPSTSPKSAGNGKRDKVDNATLGIFD